MKHHIDIFKEFGFRGELVVYEPCINAKLNEIQAAYDLLQLKHINIFINRRKEITNRSRYKGIRILQDNPNVSHTYSYFPILINREIYRFPRDVFLLKIK